jgi:hypothetical protein
MSIGVSGRAGVTTTKDLLLMIAKKFADRNLRGENASRVMSEKTLARLIAVTDMNWRQSDQLMASFVRCRRRV